MNIIRQAWFLALGLLVVVVTGGAAWRASLVDAHPEHPPRPGHRAHLDHAAFFDAPFESGPAVTRACLTCHLEAATEVMGTAHYQWLGHQVEVHGEPTRIGKRNLINNFCIGIRGNWSSCTRCHAGYGWTDAAFDFTEPSSVDCLVCHDRSGGYLKGKGGEPRVGVDLLAAARSVGYPRRDNCGVCHHNGGGGMGVKHGDLDTTLDYPSAGDDVHMGQAGMLCIDCHGGHGHDIRGRAFSVGVDHVNGIGCADCHPDRPHADERLNGHGDTIACQTCHIPSYANRVPTKTWWDWSKAGDDTREDDPHRYLKIKGEFQYGQTIVPEYAWFDLSVDRYLVGDKVTTEGPVHLNPPKAARGQPGARIWPFKVHRGRQPWDPVHRHLLPPVTAGEGGYWREFDWDKALRQGAALAGIPYSGEYDFKETLMAWPLSHMVQPAAEALGCDDCHGASTRLDWQALGYTADPIEAGGAR
jgi:octaheme c-type cytochrome (tetrathionate reductase family)